MRGLILFAALYLLTATSYANDSAIALLRGAKSLRCVFTESADTVYTDGRRTIESHIATGADLAPVVYDDINLAKNTARIIGNEGAGDMLARWQADALWLFETTPVGNVFTTTIFPEYAAGTNKFIALESRHSAFGKFVLGEMSSGTCQVLQ